MKKNKLSLQTLKGYEAYLLDAERSRATIKKYMRDIHAFYAFLPEEKIITKEVVIAYKRSLLDVYAPASSNSMLVAVNGLLAYMGLRECRVKLQRIQKRIFHDDEKDLTKEEYKRLLHSASVSNNMQLFMLMQTICTTGIRVSEHKIITVEALQCGCARVDNKGKLREIIFPKKLKRALLKYCKEQQISSGPVFITKHGKPLDRSNIWTMMKKLSKLAGVEETKVFPHNLRHLFAYTFYSLEKDLVRLADILGHSSIETTRIYTKTCLKRYQRILDRMGLFSIQQGDLKTA